jgi:acetoin utilization protein AcuB
MVAREIMTPKPITVRPRSTVREAVTLLRSLDVRHLPVVDEDRELVGMLSDRDLRGLPYLSEAVNELAGARTVRLSAPVSAIMSTDVMSVDPDDDILAVIDLLLEARVGAVPVVDPEGRLLGIVSYVDLLRAYRRDLSGE